jgi:hypothetical protein
VRSAGASIPGGLLDDTPMKKTENWKPETDNFFVPL